MVAAESVDAMAPRSASIARVDNLVEALGPGPWPVTALAELGWTPGMLRRALASGLLVRERRGLYARHEGPTTPALLPTSQNRGPTSVPSRDAAPPADRLHQARLLALARQLPSAAVFSHASAARALGLWLPNPSDATLHVTIPGQADRDDAGLRVHGSALPATSVTRVGTVAVTDACRTAVDLARPSDLPHALIAVDGALRHVLSQTFSDLDRRMRRRDVPIEAIEAARSQFLAVLDPMVGWPGVRTARAAVTLADPASASPYESWSRGWMLAVGMPAPELNVVLRGASGREYVGDFVWRDRWLIGEADGVGKYGTTSDEIRAALRAEKERQADLEAAGWRVVRWVTGDSGATIVARVGRALYLAPPLASVREQRRGA